MTASGIWLIIIIVIAVVTVVLLIRAPLSIMPSHRGMTFCVVKQKEKSTLLRSATDDRHTDGWVYSLTSKTEDYDFTTRDQLIVGRYYVLRRRTDRTLFFEETTVIPQPSLKTAT